jgi:hypothetical protein
MQMSEQDERDATQALLTSKVERALRRAVPEFAALEPADRAAFLTDALHDAQAGGLRTEQGAGAWALALWFLGPGFEARSRFLRPLLQSQAPEPRKVYALAEWTHALLGQPQDEAGADQVLKEAFYRTDAWGERD